MKLTPTTEKFIVHWGEMGTQWGVSRSVAQIQALLYLSERPLHAEQISVILDLARSNVSTSLKELLNWRLIVRTQILGDRRDHFEAIKDNWEIVMRISEGRKKREIDPTLHMLRLVANNTQYDHEVTPEQRAQIDELVGFMETMTNWYDDIRTVPKEKLLRLMKLGAKVAKFIGR
ncbi:MAG: ArsR family transcriptional regulator [Robiginitomaculum sp.]|nr:MAG: ArsR family transcriptional regulator [Robiginitomaculum sp.]